MLFRSRFAPLSLAAAICAACAACCTPSPSQGRPCESAPQKPEPGPLEAYASLREEVMKGNFIALYDRATTEYRAASFPAGKYRAMVSSDPRIKSMGLTAADVARMSAREAVDAYFKLLPMDVKAALASTLSGTKVIGSSPLSDGRAVIEIESGGVRSKLFFRKEAGEWRMDGEEKGRAEESQGNR